MSSLISAGAHKFRKAREWATPTLKTTAFLERGVLTPEEFVKAGDELVYKCPTWSWESGDSKKAKSYLPSDKQYLVTRNVPCPTRAANMENSVSLNDEDLTQIEDEACGGDDWLVSRVITPQEQQRRMDEQIEEEFEMLDDNDNDGGNDDEKNVQDAMGKVTIQDNDETKDDTPNDAATDDDADDEYADMEEFEDDNVMMDDEAAATTNTTNQDNNNPNSTTTVTNTTKDDNIVKVRTYDLSITYDKYYQTPRVWMMGYASADSSQPLTGDEMMQDVMTDYANRTVTIDPHPHVTGPHASIHPCQHGAVMKTIVKNLTKAAVGEGGGGGGGGEEEGGSSGDGGGDSDEIQGPSVEIYLFIFLKFVSSIIPTINYDFTMDVSVSTEK